LDCFFDLIDLFELTGLLSAQFQRLQVLRVVEPLLRVFPPLAFLAGLILLAFSQLLLPF